MSEEDTMVVVVSVAEVMQVAEDNNYGRAWSPWDEEELEECGSFDIYKEEVCETLNCHPENAWSRACLKIMEEENVTRIALIQG